MLQNELKHLRVPNSEGFLSFISKLFDSFLEFLATVLVVEAIEDELLLVLHGREG